MKIIHREFAQGHRIVKQHNYSATLNDGQGCWDYYYWTKLGEEIPSEKVSYVLRCKDKITGKIMFAAAGVHASHAEYMKINPPNYKGTDNPRPYAKKDL